MVGGHRAYRAESLPWQEEGGKSPVRPDYAWLLERPGKVEQGDTGEQAKVLLLAYPRTGSSLLGELLTAAPSTSYFMEPLFGLLPVGQLDWEYALEGRLEDGEVPGEAVAALMAGIYSCEERVVDRLVAWSEAPHTSVTAAPLLDCTSSKAILSKTVRLHGAQVAQVAARVEHLRVVHLVRDPRAVAASLQAQAEEWGGRTASTYCRQLLADLQVGEELGPGRYLKVTYEELVEKPLEVLDCVADELTFAQRAKLHELCIEEMKDELKGKTQKYIELLDEFNAAKKELDRANLKLKCERTTSGTVSAPTRVSP